MQVPDALVNVLDPHLGRRRVGDGAGQRESHRICQRLFLLITGLRNRGQSEESGGLTTFVGVIVAGVYGGYFGAAQGILLMAFLGILLEERMQRLNAVKNVLAGLVNLVAAVVFVFSTEVAWDAVAVIAVGSTIGGQLGGMYGRRLSPTVLRGIIVVVGTTAAVRLLVT